MKKSMTSLFVALFLTGATAMASSANNLDVSFNQASGDPEHISEIGLTIDGLSIRTGNVLNTLGNDVGGKITVPMYFAGDSNAQLVLTVDNQKQSGHKVVAGSTLTLVLGDGSSNLLATVEGSPSESMFSYNYDLSLQPGVSAQGSSVVGPVYDTYFRNALNVCMKQSVHNVTKQLELTVADKKLVIQTFPQTENVGPETVALGHYCKN